MKKLAFGLVLIGFSTFLFLFIFSPKNNQFDWLKPTSEEYVEEEEFNEEKYKKKVGDWSEKDALRHQKLLSKYAVKQNKTRGRGDLEAFGSLQGRWFTRAANNMPGAYLFAEMLDGTDTIYGVTLNHYAGEFNARSFIWKGTVYNPNTGTKGDDFVCLTPQWPNRYQDLIVFKNGGKTRLVALIQNGPVYWSEDDGQTWNSPSGLPSVIYSIALNRQDGRMYATDGTSVYLSTDNGNSYSILQNFGSYGDAVLYSPRYDNQSDASKVYLAKEGKFYELNAAKTSFTEKGTYTWSGHGRTRLSIGGDSRKLYVTEDSNFWVSENQGTSWTQKYPKGNWYGDRTGKMSAGQKIGVSPENPDYVMGGYAQPVFSTDGLNTTVSTNSGWGSYQNGTGLSLKDYQDRIRFNYHPDFQACQFFYNSSNELFTVGSTDGGLFMSYKVWKNPLCDACGSYDNSGYDGDFININTLGMPSALIYRNNMFTGNKDTKHIVYSTQDQGTQDYIMESGGDTLNVYQTIGGDGPPLNSADGNWVWMWKREGQEVWIPEELYDGSGNRRNIGTVRGLINSNSSTTIPRNTRVGWVQSFIDKDEPSKRMWLLTRDLVRAEVSGSSISNSVTDKGTTHQVCAFAQAEADPNVAYFLQEGKVYKTTNRGDSWDSGRTTRFTITSNYQNMGSGWVLPGNDNWVLFAGPSGNGVGAILTKDGGASWIDVTGSFPAGDDFQVGGMTGSPDGKYVFAGTEIGPWVFVVEEEEWYPMYGGEAGMFNTTAIEYIESDDLVRFGTWGNGVMEFAIDDNSPKITLSNVASSYNLCDSLKFNWTSSNVSGTVEVSLLNNGVETDSWTFSSIERNRFSTFLQEGDFEEGSNYTVTVTAGGITSTSSVFSIVSSSELYDQNNIAFESTTSEHSNDRLASLTIDGDNSTFWHTEWSPNNVAPPHEIIYKTNSTENFSAFSYLSRQDGSENGRVQGFEIYGSADNKLSWTLLKSGDLSNSSLLQIVSFNQSMTCDYIKFVATSEVNGNNWASMAEFNLYTAVSCAEVITDCNGDDNGTASIDNCGICSGGNSGVVSNASCVTKCSDPIEVYTSSFQSPNSGDLTLDDDLNTRWSAEGDGEWILYKFPCPRIVSTLQLAFFSGDVRTSTFDVEVSADNVNWTNIGQFTSSGTSLGLEDFTINSNKINYFKIIGRGNSANTWNSYTEIDFEFSLKNDCNTELGGLAIVDSCGTCAGGNTGEELVLDPNACVVTSTAELNTKLKVYPTVMPAGITINISNYKGVVQVYSMDGKLVFNDWIDTKLTTQNWSPGTYLLKFVDDGSIHREKVIIK